MLLFNDDLIVDAGWDDIGQDCGDNRQDGSGNFRRNIGTIAVEYPNDNGDNSAGYHTDLQFTGWKVAAHMGTFSGGYGV